MKRALQRKTRRALEDALAVVPLEDEESSGVAGLIDDIRRWDDDFIAGILLDLGGRASSVEEPELAIRLYRLSLALGRRSVELYHNIGNALTAAGDDAAAVVAYGQAIDLDPSASMPLYNRGVTRLRNSDDGGLDDLIAAARLGETFPRLPDVLCAQLVERSGFESVYELLASGRLPPPSCDLLLAAVADSLATAHYQFQRPAAMPYRIDESLRRSCILADFYHGTVPPDTESSRLRHRFVLLDRLQAAAARDPDIMTDWLVHYAEGLLAYAIIGTSRFPEHLPWDVPTVLTTLIEADGHERTVHSHIDQRDPELPAERSRHRLAQFAQRCFRRAANSLRNHPDVTMGRLDPVAARFQWSVSEDLFRDWARCCEFLGSPLELVEAIEEARYRCGALASHLLLSRDASSALVDMLPSGLNPTAKPDLVHPVGKGTMLLDYFTVEIMEDRLICAALSDGADMIFETEISTERGEGTQSTLAALIEANEHWGSARHLPAQPLRNRSDDPGAAARMRRAALGSRYPELPNRIHSELDDILLGPVRNQLDEVERLFVAPFNYLHNFPFHALESIQAHLSSGTLEEVVYVPSARLAFEIAARLRPPAERCLFVGYSARNDLPVEEELGLVESKFSRTVGLTGKEATVGNVVRNLGDVDVVHFCCHGRFDSGTDAIYLELADGGLYSWDLLTAPAFTPQLVFANTCISGVSQRFGTNGDQPLSLPTAALLRGAQNVIGTLWEVQDDVALAFAARFYDRWLGDEARGASRAAQATQMELKQSFEELQLWAAHAVFGGGR